MSPNDYLQIPTTTTKMLNPHTNKNVTCVNRSFTYTMNSCWIWLHPAVTFTDDRHETLSISLPAVVSPHTCGFYYARALIQLPLSNPRQCPRREAGDVWCLPPVWNLRAVIWFHFAISSLVLLPSSVTLSVWSFSACWPFLLDFFQKILQYFALRDRLFVWLLFSG